MTFYEGQPKGYVTHHCYGGGSLESYDLCDKHHTEPCEYREQDGAYCYPRCASLSNGCKECAQNNEEKKA